jgi:hypothetical protein
MCMRRRVVLKCGIRVGEGWLALVATTIPRHLVASQASFGALAHLWMWGCFVPQLV